MKLTRLDLNSWLLEAGGLRVLIDPWLVGPLVFYGQPWLFCAHHKTPPAYRLDSPPDLLLLSQGLEDHAHPETLALLPRHIPVVASASAAGVVRRLGYQKITVLAPGQIFRQGELLIQAVPGAQVQGQRENGYLIADGKNCLYYEPHLAPDNLQNYLRSPVDSLLIPVVGQAFPLLGEVIMGPARALALVQQLQPRAVIPTAIGDLNLSGFLPPLIRTLGTLEQFAQQLQQTAPQITFYQPAPGETVIL